MLIYTLPFIEAWRLLPHNLLIGMATEFTKADVLATTLRIAKGNVSPSIKDEMANWTQFANPKHCFGYGENIRMYVTDMNVAEVEDATRKQQTQMVIELDPTEG